MRWTGHKRQFFDMIKEDFAIQSNVITNVNIYFIQENGYINKINTYVVSAITKELIVYNPWEKLK
jgi:hypothetical protein